MNIGTIFSLVETIIANAPKAWAIIKAGIADVEAAADVKAKLSAIVNFAEAAVVEIKAVIQGL